MRIDLVADAQEICRKNLEDNGIKLKHEDDPILDWFTFCERIIENKPRNIVRAKNFMCPPEYKKKLRKLEKQIEKGANLTPYLSRSIINSKRDDLMLYDWGIYHLHVSDGLDTKKNDGFMKRSGLLLYALFNDDNAYFIRTIPHSGEKNMWTKQECLGIVYENWPNLLSICKMVGVSEDSISDKDKTNLRKNHCNSFITLKDGTVIAPPNLGIMTDGSSLKMAIKADQFRFKIKNIEHSIISNIENHFSNAVEFVKLVAINEDHSMITLEINMENIVKYKFVFI